MGRKTGRWSSALLSVNTSQHGDTKIWRCEVLGSDSGFQTAMALTPRFHTQRCNNYLNGSQISCIQAVGETSTWLRQQCMDALTQTQKTSLVAVQMKVALLACGIKRTDRKTSVSGLVQRLGWEKLYERQMNRRLQLFRQMHFSESNTITRHI